MTTTYHFPNRTQRLFQHGVAFVARRNRHFDALRHLQIHFSSQILIVLMIYCRQKLSLERLIDVGSLLLVYLLQAFHFIVAVSLYLLDRISFIARSYQSYLRLFFSLCTNSTL